MSEFCAGNCAGCPYVKADLLEIQDREWFSDMVAKAAISEELDEAVPQFFETIKKHDLVSLLELRETTLESPEDLAVALRKNAAELTEGFDVVVQQKKENLERRIMGCVGPLTMRAVKAGVEVTVKVCMNAPDEDSFTEPAEVRRRMITE